MVIKLNKNMIYDVKIDSISSSGFGVCRIDGMVVFVANAVTGDEVRIKIIKAKKNYAVARVEKILKKSHIRIESDCDVFKKCGGCAYRNITYDAESQIKQTVIKDAFLRIGGIDINVDEYVGASSRCRYRNKGQYPISRENGELKIGFYATRTHNVVDCRNCLLHPELFSKIINEFAEFVDEEKISVYDEKTEKGLLRHIYLRIAQATGEVMVCVVINGKKLPQREKLVKRLTDKFPQIRSIAINFNTEKTNVILGNQTEIIWGKNYITDVLCGVKVQISPMSFYQVNRVQAEKLYKKVDEYASLSGKEKVVDLYCGAGTIGLSMAKKVKKIIGVEIVEQAVENARENAKINNIENAEFICGDAEQCAKILYERKEKADVLIDDPPRKGLTDDLIDTIVKMNPERLVYVSCDVATMARDCKIFKEKGYEIDKLSAFDLFPGTIHVETVCLLSRK